MWPLGSYSSAYILEAIDFIFFSLHLVPLRQMQASWKCGALSQSSTTWEQIHVFVWAQLAHEQTLSQGNECLKRWGRAHTLFLKYLGKTDMITENKACLLKKKRERKKNRILVLQQNHSLHTRTMLCICWLHLSRSRIESTWEALGSLWAQAPSRTPVGLQPWGSGHLFWPLSLSPSPGRKGCSLWFHGVCFPCTHTVKEFTVPRTDGLQKRIRKQEG